MHRSMSRSTPYLPRYQSVSPARSPHLGSRRFSSPRSTSQPSQRIVYIDNAPSRVINSYHVHHSPSPNRTYKIHLCSSKTKNHLTRVTRSHSACDINSSHVYTSQEEIFVRSFKESTLRQVGSSEDIYQAVPFFPDVTPSESGVSFGDWEEGSTFGGEDDNVSQHSFGSSSAFCEVTIDSELDKCDSDNFSGPDYIGDRALSILPENDSDTNYEIKKRRSRRSNDGLDSRDYRVVRSVSDTQSREKESVSSQPWDYKFQTQPDALSVLIPENEISGKINGDLDKVGSRGIGSTPLAHSTPHVSPGGPGDSKLCVVASWDADAIGEAITSTAPKTTPARTLPGQGSDTRNSSRFEDSSCNSSCSEDNYSDVSNVTTSSPIIRKTKLVKKHSDKPVSSKKPLESHGVNQSDFAHAGTVESERDQQQLNSASVDVKQHSDRSAYTLNDRGVRQDLQKFTTDRSDNAEQTDKSTGGNEWWASYNIGTTAGHKSEVISREGDTEKSLAFRRVSGAAKPLAVNIPLITAGKHGQEKLRKLSQMSPPLVSPTNGSPPVFPNDRPNLGENEKLSAEHLITHAVEEESHGGGLVKSDNIQNHKWSDSEAEDSDKHQDLSKTSLDTTENRNFSVSGVENPTNGEICELELFSGSLPSAEESVHDWHKKVNENARTLSYVTEKEGVIAESREAVEVMKLEPANLSSQTVAESTEPVNNIASIQSSSAASIMYGRSIAENETLDVASDLAPVEREDSHNQIAAQSPVEDDRESTGKILDQLHVTKHVSEHVGGICHVRHSTQVDIGIPSSQEEFISKQSNLGDHQNAISLGGNEASQDRTHMLEYMVDNTPTPSSESTVGQELHNGETSSGHFASSDDVNAVLFAKNSYALDTCDSDSCRDINDTVLLNIVPGTAVTAVATENIVTPDLQFSDSVPTVSSVNSSIIAENGYFENSQALGVDNKHMGNTTDYRDVPQVVLRDVSSQLFVDIVKPGKADLDLGQDTTHQSGNSLPSSCSDDNSQEVNTPTSYISPSSSQIANSLEQQLLHTLEECTHEAVNTDNSITTSESFHIEGTDKNIPKALFVESTDKHTDVVLDDQKGCDVYTKDALNFVERQESVYCPNFGAKAVIVLDRSSRLIESSTCITSPTVNAQNKVNYSVLENSPCDDSVSVNRATDNAIIEAFNTTDKEIFTSTDKKLLTSADKEIFTSTDKKVLTSTDKEIFTSTDKKVLTSTDKEIFTSTDKKVLTSTDKEIFTTTDKKVFTPTDREVFTTTDKKVFTPTDKEIFATTDKKVFTPTDKEIFATTDKVFTSKDKEIFTTTDKKLFTPTDKEVFTATDKKVSTSVDKEVFTATDKKVFTPTDKEVFTTTDKKIFTTTDKKVFTSSNKEIFTTTDKVFTSTDREVVTTTDKVFTPTDKEIFTTTDNKIFTTTDKKVFIPTEKKVFTPTDNEILTTTSKEVLTPTDKEVFTTTDEKVFTSTDKEVFTTTVNKIFTPTDKKIFISTVTKVFTPTDKEIFTSTVNKVFTPTDKQISITTDKEVLTATDKEVLTATDKEVLTTTDKEVLTTTDKEVLTATDKEVLTKIDKQIFTAADKEILTTQDKETCLTTYKDYIVVTQEESCSEISKQNTISTETKSVDTCLSVSSTATSGNIAAEITHGLSHPALAEQVTIPPSTLSTSCLDTEASLTLSPSSVSSSVLVAGTSFPSDHFLTSECEQEIVTEGESGLDFAYSVSSPVTNISKLEAEETFDSRFHTLEATMHPNSPLDKLQARLALLSGDTGLNINVDRVQHQVRAEAPDTFQNIAHVDTCDFVDFSKDPYRSVSEENVLAHTNGDVVNRDALDNSVKSGVKSNAGSHAVRGCGDSDYDNVTSSMPMETQLYTRPRHLHLLQYAHTKTSDLWALQEETESAMNTPSPKQPRVTFGNEDISSNRHSCYSARIIHHNSTEQNVQNDQIKKMLNGQTSLVSDFSSVEKNREKESTLSTVESNSVKFENGSEDIRTLSEITSIGVTYDAGVQRNHVADDESGKPDISPASTVHREASEINAGVFRAQLINISPDIENAQVNCSVDEDRSHASQLGTLTSNLGLSTNGATVKDLQDTLSSLDALTASLKQFNIPDIDTADRKPLLLSDDSPLAPDSGNYDFSSIRTYEIERSRVEDNKASSYLPTQNLDLSVASTTETSTETNNGSVYKCTGTAEIKKTLLNDTPVNSPETNFRPVYQKPVLNHKLTNAKIKQFEKILYEFNRGLRTSQDITDFLFFCENYADYRDSSASSSEELYKYFTNDDSEKVQNHTCITVEDEDMNTFRFKRYLKKSHSKRNNGRKILRFLSKLSCVSETLSSPMDKPNGKVKNADKDAHIFSTDSMTNPRMRISNPVLISSTSFQLHNILNSSPMRYDTNGNTSFDSVRTSADSAYSSLSEPSLGSLSSPAFRPTAATSESVSSVFNLDLSTGDWTFPDNVFSNTSDAAIRTSFAKNARNQPDDQNRDTMFSLSDEFHHFNFSESEIDGALLNRLRYGHAQAELN